MLTKKNILVGHRDTPESNPELFNEYNQAQIADIKENNRFNYGINYNQSDAPSVTYRTNIPQEGHPPFIYKPGKVATTGVHELGHTAQKIDEWGRITTKFNPDFGYYTANTDTELGQRFADAMVEPVKLNATDIKEGRSYNYQTWLSSPNELHADLMKARLRIYNSWLKSGISKEDIFKALQNPEDELVEWMVKEGDLDKFFKESTPLKEKISLIKLLPAFTGAALATGIGGSALSEEDDSTLGPVYQEGGYIEAELTNEEIEQYKKRGYIM